jgi:hypothetical protein
MLDLVRFDRIRRMALLHHHSAVTAWKARPHGCGDSPAPPGEHSRWGSFCHGNENAAQRRCPSQRTLLLGTQLFEPLAHDVFVDLRGRKVAMPKQHLQHAQVGAVLEQVSGEGMPECAARARWRGLPCARNA